MTNPLDFTGNKADAQKTFKEVRDFIASMSPADQAQIRIICADIDAAVADCPSPSLALVALMFSLLKIGIEEIS